ncbi:MAG: Uncharacterized MFS-type transporter, partial [uncultured Blastococcus sp.]
AADRPGLAGPAALRRQRRRARPDHRAAVRPHPGAEHVRRRPRRPLRQAPGPDHHPGPDGPARAATGHPRRDRRDRPLARLRPGSGVGVGLGDRRPGAAGVRLGDGRPRSAGERGEPELHDLQRGPPDRARAGRPADRGRVGGHRERLLPQRGQLRLHDRRAGRHARCRAAAQPARGPGPGPAAGGGGLHLGASGPGARDGPGVRDRHLRLQLPGDHRPHGARAVPARRGGVRPALHDLRRRLAHRCPALHPAQRPPTTTLPDRLRGDLRAPDRRRRPDADLRLVRRPARAHGRRGAGVQRGEQQLRAAGRAAADARPGHGALLHELHGGHARRCAADRPDLRAPRRAVGPHPGRRGLRGHRPGCGCVPRPGPAGAARGTADPTAAAAAAAGGRPPG